MNIKDQERIIHLLNLSTGQFDGESLNAIRKANELLQKEKLNWNEFFNIKSTDFNSNENNWADIIQNILKTKYHLLTAWEKEALPSIRLNYLRFGNLTEKQIKIVRRYM